MELRARLIVFERFNSLAEGFFEAGMLEEDELLMEGLAGFPCVVRRGVLNEEEAEDFSEELDVIFT